jgi:hypothetical protein
MTLAADNDVAGGTFAIEDISTGMHASGFGEVGDGRSFSFRVDRQTLFVEIYRPWLAGWGRRRRGDSQPRPRRRRR